jgi:metallophosphoesterase (TIGR03767 family)
MTTGDNSDNTQLNETRLSIETLDGGRTVDPDSGVRGTCGTDPNGPRYAGVRGGGEYYEPDTSAPGTDGPGYSTSVRQNQGASGRTNDVRDVPGLFEQMNLPFSTTGLGVPWYGIFGNHDGLIQGNQPRNPALEAYATGCVKVHELSPQGRLALTTALGSGLPAGQMEGRVAGIVIEDALRTAGAATVDPALARIVPSDAKRRPLRKREYIAEHFDTTGRPVGHGFTQANLDSGQGNYTVSPLPGVRFIVLDSMSETGGADGNIDDPQFRWLHEQLLLAEARREIVFAFAHHSVRTLVQSPASGFGAGDQGGEATPLVHLGGADETEPCPLTDRVAPPTPDETLRCLFLRHPGLVGYVSGHEHINRITPFERRNGAGSVTGGFWEITTAAHIDWPQQSRVMDLLDNRDGTLSILATLVDHAAPADPRSTTDRTVRLAALDRELSFNDPDAQNGEDGTSDARGTRADRNVELLLRNPYGR